MKSILEILSKNIRVFREQRGLSQDALGILADISGQTVASYERQLRWPDLAQVKALAEALKVPEAALFADGIEVVRVEGPSLKELLLALAALDDPQIRRHLDRIAGDVAAEAAGAANPTPNPGNKASKPGKSTRDAR